MWESIKKILKKNSGTCIIVEEGEPAYVVLPFSDYQNLLEKEPFKKEGMSEQDLLEKINQEINDWKSKQSEDAAEIELEDEAGDGDLKVENLPLV